MSHRVAREGGRQFITPTSPGLLLRGTNLSPGQCAASVFVLADSDWSRISTRAPCLADGTVTRVHHEMRQSRYVMFPYD